MDFTDKKELYSFSSPQIFIAIKRSTEVIPNVMKFKSQVLHTKISWHWLKYRWIWDIGVAVFILMGMNMACNKLIVS